MVGRSLNTSRKFEFSYPLHLSQSFEDKEKAIYFRRYAFVSSYIVLRSDTDYKKC